MFLEDVNKLVEEVILTGETVKQFESYFRAIAGKRLSQCKDLNGVLSNCGIVVNGDNEELTREIYLNSIILLSVDEGQEIYLSDDRAIIFANKTKKSAIKSDAEVVLDWFLSLKGLDSEISETEDKLCSVTKNTEVLNLVKSDEDEEELNSNKNLEVSKNKIKEYYYQFYKGVVDELAKRYTSLFESGYEVISPAGILARDGMIGLSGNTLVVKKFNISVMNMYKLFSEKLNFIEVSCRSNISIADTIYDSYTKGEKRLLYFPNKLLEYAYGRKAPSGDNKNSIKTYENHASSANWSAYCSSEVIKSLKSLIGSSVVKFVFLTAENGDYFNEGIAARLQDYLVYLQRCLSLCLLMVDYKNSKRGIDEDISAFKIRICDPMDSLGYGDLTGEIIRTAFMGSTGEAPFSYTPRFEKETYIKEYAHEFNHDSSQASPLFAYKAFLSLNEQGVEPDWNNMILGMFEDGTILRNGKRGVSLNSRLTHHIDAGSRAGKGVMTLNILASGIYSNKNIFYLDRKPDMASMFKNISPNMFVVNGAQYSREDDFYGTFANASSWINKGNIPGYLLDMLEVGDKWSDLGDLFYMRALKLVMGIIIARGDGRLEDPNFGGKDGILLVVDEFKNFQESYALLVNKMKSNLPAASDKYELEKGNLDKLLAKHGENSPEYRVALDSFNRSYNDGSFYALSYLNSMVSDLEFLSTKRDAGFNPAENSLSDIFVIGQHLEHGDIDFAEFRNMLVSGRYKQMGRRGITGSYKIDFTKGSFGYSMVSFKTCDAFFGRNMDDGREVYLAQTNKNSKAYGRLDDKASNFAYMSSFTNEKRRKIVNGGVGDNVELANSCVYFKPFLVLNDAKKGDIFTNQMFARCQGPNPETPWITPDDIIRENPNEDGTFVNEAVGFEGYLTMMGIKDYSEVLSKGSSIANYVVRECLKYDGNWLEFITDLRPTALFTIKDIVEGARGDTPSMLDYANNPITSEFVKHNPIEFGLRGIDSDINDGSEYISSGEKSVFDFMDEEDSDMSYNENDFDDIFTDNETTKEGVNQNTPIGEDEEIDIFNDDFYTSINEEDEKILLKEAGTKDAEIKELLRRLQHLGVNINISEAESDYINSPEHGGRSYKNVGDGYVDFDSANETVFNERLEFSEDIESLEDLIELVTEDILNKFGGIDSIVSFKVVGGSIVVNGYYYRCKAGDLFAKNIPYDIKREINSGNISRLFNYSLLLKMGRLRDLEFDSTKLVYDYVSYGMGYGSQISVDLFFRDLKSLQCLCIGKRLFKRDTYMKQIRNDDVFYHPRTATKFANFSEDMLGNISKSSWQFTKNTFNSKKYGAVMKTIGVTGGLVATSVSAGSRIAVKGGRRLFKGLVSFSQSVKDIIEESKKY